KPDPNSHFMIREVRSLSETEWDEAIKASNRADALIFVHGYNNSFNDSLYQMAQIVWDLKYRGTAVLFSWPSRASRLEYVYDQQSALISAPIFTGLLKKLSALGIKRLHVLAHSMGNFVTMEALKGQAGLTDPLKIAELIMAAPDVDR